MADFARLFLPLKRPPVSQAIAPITFVVDDEPIIAETLAAILCRQGYAATSFTRPNHALSEAAKTTVEILITDVVMPLMSGVELAVAIKKLCPDCIVLLFSGQANQMDPLKPARDHGHDFPLLPKPIHPSKLLRELARLRRHR